MKEKITELIHEINEYEDFESDTDLFEEDVLDSMTLVLLINRIEETLDIFIPEDVVTLENFATVDKMVATISAL